MIVIIITIIIIMITCTGNWVALCDCDELIELFVNNSSSKRIFIIFKADTRSVEPCHDISFHCWRESQHNRHQTTQLSVCVCFFYETRTIQC